ncbi:MAG: class I SAM-dependent methyltransferase [Clostridia bacterium]|nr:class I SAM-dependent methyltransferase [Clostridia bacterium]
MKNTPLFDSVAEFYDYSMRNNCDYEGWAQYVVNKIKTLSPNAKQGIDMACGSGYFTRAFKKAGFAVTGMDISAEMLTSAQNITAKEKAFIPYILGDMTSFKVMQKVDFITAINDAVNCLPPQNLQKAFKCMANALKKGGILHFDVSSEYKLKQVISNNTFCEDDDDYSYIWFNTPYDDKVVMEMSIFLKRGENYIKRESSLTEYIHTKENLILALEKSGFTVLDIDGDMGELTANSQRLNITAKRN